MKRLVKILFFLALIGLAVVLIAPSFIDWNRHKDQITAQISSYFQRKIDIGGNVSLQIIPQPEITLENVTIANKDGAASGPLLTLKQLGVRVKFEPLLEGRVEVESLDLVDPVLNLEILEDGSAGWAGVLKETSADVLGGAAASVALNRVSVANGELHYTNRVTGAEMKIENLNLAVMADTLLGPYSIAGSMKYRNLPVNVDIATEKYTSTASIPLRLSLMPASGLPQVKFDGIMDMQSGLDLQGEIAVAQGNLGSLFDMKGLSRLHFMQEDVDMKGVLEFKGDQFSVSDIKAKFGAKGDLQGKLLVQFSRGGKPSLHLEAEASNLVLSDKSGDFYPEVPEALAVSIHGKGKNIVWGGVKLAAAAITVDSDQKDWKIKSGAADLAGGTQVKFSGTTSPEAEKGSYAIQLTTADLGKFASLLNPAENSIFKYFSDTGMIKKMSLAAGLEISPVRISFFNVDAAIEEKMKLSGVVNIDRTSQRLNFTARLNATDWNVSAFQPEAYNNFWQKVLQTDADIELDTKNFLNKGFKITEMSLKGKIDPQGLNFLYDLKADPTGEGASAVPPPLRAWKNADIKGELKGNAAKYSFTAAGHAEGGEVTLGGDLEGDAYQMNIQLQNQDAARALELMGMPVARLATTDGAFKFSGELRGNGDNYVIGKIQAQTGAATLSGSLEKKDGKTEASLTAQKLDLDKWLAGDWRVKHDISLKLQGGTLVFQGLSLSNPQLTVETGASSVKIPDLEGTLWDGQLKAEAALTRQGQQWSSSIKGSLKKADPNLMTARLGLAGFSMGTGDIDFELSSPDNTPAGATGHLEIKTSALKIGRLNFDKLGDTIDQLTQVPVTLHQLMDDSLRKNGDTVFANAAGSVKVDKGKLSIDSLKLDGAYGTVIASGSLNVKAGSYKVSANLQLNHPEGVPAISIQCTEAADCVVDTEAVGKFVVKNNPAPVPVQPDVSPLPAPATAQPPVQSEDKNAVKGILQRLNEEEKKPSAPQKPDISKAMQNMMMQEMMPSAGAGAVP